MPHYNKIDERWVYAIKLCRMSQSITVRLTDELQCGWSDRARLTGVPVARVVREQLQKARAEGARHRFLRHAGKISGPPDLSSREGFARR